MLFDDDPLEAAMAVGTGYALYRHGQDQQTAALINAINHANQPVIDNDITRDVEDHPSEPQGMDRIAAAPNALEFTENLPQSWEEYIGQDPLKLQLQVAMQSALIRGAPLPHILLASGYPGVGKTKMARLLAHATGVNIIELVPPFNIFTLVEAAKTLQDKDILFIDEIHKLTDGVGQRGAEILLKILEDRVAYMPDGTVVPLNLITIIGATTDRDKLPETVIDRFKLKPYFQAYSDLELIRIAIKFAYHHRAQDAVTDDLAFAISGACRGTPRIAEEMVLAARDLALVGGIPPSPSEMLEFLEIEPDGLTRNHGQYLTDLRTMFRQVNKAGDIEYIAGEAALQQRLRETKQGIGRVENFLLERGLIDRTPRGRRLTTLGIERADDLISRGKVGAP